MTGWCGLVRFGPGVMVEAGMTGVSGIAPGTLRIRDYLPKRLMQSCLIFAETDPSPSCPTQSEAPQVMSMALPHVR